MPTKQTVTRKGSFDAAHRVMHERVKCYNIHGHLYQYELTFSFDSMPEINGSYAIDFKEIKRIGVNWLDETFDHGSLLNPHDTLLIEVSKQLKSKYWLMSLYGEGNFCNPSAENIAKEIFLAMKILFAGRSGGLRIEQVRLYETLSCFTDCTAESITLEEENNFNKARMEQLIKYRTEKGVFDYDARTGTCSTSHIEN